MFNVCLFKSNRKRDNIKIIAFLYCGYEQKIIINQCIVAYKPLLTPTSCITPQYNNVYAWVVSVSEQIVYS